MVSLAQARNLAALGLYGTPVTDTGLGHLASLSLTRFDVGGTGVTDAGLRHIEPDELQALGLDHTGVSNDGLARLVASERIEELSITGTQIDDEGFAAVASLHRLRFLDAAATTMDAGLEHISGLTTLRSLRLALVALTDVGLAHLSALTDLRHLDLERTRISGAGLVHLHALERLTRLNLDRTMVSGALEPLANMQRLQLLNLQGTPTGDEVLPVLTALRALEFVDLSLTQITEGGIARLARERPDLDVMPPTFGDPHARTETRIRDHLPEALATSVTPPPLEPPPVSAGGLVVFNLPSDASLGPVEPGSAFRTMHAHTVPVVFLAHNNAYSETPEVCPTVEEIRERLGNAVVEISARLRVEPSTDVELIYPDHVDFLLFRHPDGGYGFFMRERFDHGDDQTDLCAAFGHDRSFDFGASASLEDVRRVAGGLLTAREDVGP